jgi:putative transposase
MRNGMARARKVTTAAGQLEVQAPRVDDRRADSHFRSAILPPWARRSPKVAEVLPLLYLRGISTRDFVPALAEFFGSEAGLSASTIQRLPRGVEPGAQRVRSARPQPGRLRLHVGRWRRAPRGAR